MKEAGVCWILQVTEAETELVQKLPQLWDDLVLKSKNIDASLVVVKRKFTEVCSNGCSVGLVYMQRDARLGQFCCCLYRSI